MRSTPTVFEGWYRNSDGTYSICFYPRGYVPRNRTVLRMWDARGQSGLDIPPGEIAVTQQFHVLPGLPMFPRSING